jgi:hypothetical protein
MANESEKEERSLGNMEIVGNMERERAEVCKCDNAGFGIRSRGVRVLTTWAFGSSEVDGAVGFGHGGLEHVLGLLRAFVVAKIYS